MDASASGSDHLSQATYLHGLITVCKSSVPQLPSLVIPHGPEGAICFDKKAMPRSGADGADIGKAANRNGRVLIVRKSLWADLTEKVSAPAPNAAIVLQRKRMGAAGSNGRDRLLVRLERIARNTEYVGAKLAELRQQRVEVDALGGAAGRRQRRVACRGRRARALVPTRPVIARERSDRSNPAGAEGRPRDCFGGYTASQ